MFKIVNQEFYPIQSDKDFKVMLRPLSYADFMEISIATAKGPADGPEVLSDKLSSNYEFMKSLFSKAIVRVEGCQVEGAPITTGDELFKIATRDVVHAISDKLIEQLKLSETERKN